MVVHNLYIVRVGTGPSEAYSPLVIYSHAVLSGAIAIKLFQLISGWRAQVIESNGRIKLSQFP